MSLILVNNDKIPFYEYLENNPHLWDNVVGLTDSEKAFINEEFWDLDVKPKTFSRHFLHEVDKYLDQYLELKEIQFNDKLKDLVTNERLRTIIGNATNNLTRNSTRNGTSTGTNSNTTNIDTNVKEANRQLPMNSSGSDLDDIVDWSKGASTAGENQTSGTNSVTGQESLTNNDTLTLTDLNTQANTGSITDKEMNEQAVNCIKRIWSYLTEPKALEWFCYKLRKCFILSL